MKNLGGLVRQARYRARRHGVTCDLTTGDVDTILLEHRGRCAYCDRAADCLDNLMPMADGGPNTPANLVPACRGCKALKRGRSLAWMLDGGHVGGQRCVELLRVALARRGGPELRPLLRRVIGVPD